MKQSDPPSRLVGERYQVKGPLGKGGAAQIYEVVDVTTGKALALKQLHGDTSEKLQQLFELEYRTLARLNHPHTVQVFDFGQDADGAYYTMELLVGEDLSGCGPLPWRSVCRYLADAARALSVLHAHGLIHRDVSARNLWRTPDDVVKLIDFGALTPFGINPKIVGTPPCVPPEALRGQALDQRADLYALGAVAYYLLCGRHAYPARTLQELGERWRVPPVPPSHYIASLGGEHSEPIPRELDALVASLLQHNVTARPNSSAEVLDRLDSLLGRAVGADTAAAQACVANTKFVGRSREMRRLLRQLSLARSGRGQLAVIEGPAGSGRSRLLDELGQQARVLQTTVLRVEGGCGPGSYALASTLGLALLEALPERAREAARPHRGVLAHLNGLAERLGSAPAAMPAVAGELRTRLQHALSGWLSAVARDNALLVVVDSIERADLESLACLHHAALHAGGASLMFVCGLLTDAGHAPRPVEEVLRKAARSLQLGPLSEADHAAMLESVFGQAEHLARLSARLFRVTRGNPGHTLELCRQLIQRGTVGLVNGMWVLPRELGEHELVASRDQALLGRLEHLSPRARMLAGVLSAHEGPLRHELVALLVNAFDASLLAALPELLSQEVVLPSGTGVVFTHEQLRIACASALSTQDNRRARSVLAERALVSSEADSGERARAGLHLLSCADPRGAEVVVATALWCTMRAVDGLSNAAPSFELALRMFREAGRPEAEQVVLLAALARAGYDVDPRYNTQYGEQAVSALQALVGLPEARKYRGVLGARGAVLFALVHAGLRLWRQRGNPLVPSLPQAIELLMVSVVSSAATRATFFDPDGASRYVQVLEPFAALGRDHVAGFMYEYGCALADTTRDQFARAAARWQRILARLDHKKTLKGSTDELLRVCRAGALFALGGIVAHRDDDAALAAIRELDQGSFALHHGYGAQVGAVYHGYRGRLAEFARHKAQVEQLAIQRGASWQVETWIPGPISALALLLHDAIAMKQASEQMKRWSQIAPSLRVHARHMHGAYLLMRGRCAEALPWLEDCLHERPRARIAWGRSHGVLARAYNRLDQHAKARDACLRVLSVFDDDEADFPALNLIVHTEMAIAEAGLGDSAAAQARVDALLARFRAHGNPLTLGHLYETQLEIALLAGDVTQAQDWFARMVRCYAGVGASSLLQRCGELKAATEARVLAERGKSSSRADWSAPGTLTGEASSYLTLLADQLAASRTLGFEDRAKTALRVLVANAQATTGALFLSEQARHAKPVATLGAVSVGPQLRAWVEQCMQHELEEPDTADADAETVAEALQAQSTYRDGALVFRCVTLCRGSATDSRILGVVALGSDRRMPMACSVELVQLVTELLSQSANAAPEVSPAGLRTADE